VGCRRTSRDLWLAPRLESNRGPAGVLQPLQLRDLSGRYLHTPNLRIVFLTNRLMAHQAQQADLKLQVGCWIARRSRHRGLIQVHK
jgi:hypothetical protein